MIYLANINLNQNELQNAVLQPLSTPPPNPKLGQIYTNSSTSKIMWYTGSEWKTVGVIVESSSVNGKIKIDGIEMTVYTLPIASDTELGGIKVGAGLTINASGILSTTGGGIADSVDWTGVIGRPTKLSEFENDPAFIDKNVTGLTNYTDTNTLNTELGEKVDKVAGKGLSTEDYTTAEKDKLTGIAAGAEVNVQSDWNQATTGADDFIKNKPTKLSQFTNDSAFLINTANNLTNYYKKTETYTQEEVNTLIGNLQTIQIEVVASLPVTGASNKIYLVNKTPGQTTNLYDEFIWVASTSKYEKIGDTEIDLSTYLTKTGDAKDTTVTFATAGTRVLPLSTEKLSVIVGKVVKYLTDLKTVAFTGSYNDLSNLPPLVKSATSTITTGTLTKSVAYTGVFVNATVIDNTTKELVLCDVIVNASTVVFTIAKSHPNTLNLTVFYI